MEEETKLDPEVNPVAQFVTPFMRGLLFRERGHQRSGFTKNHGQPRNKTRARMARASRKMNRG